MRLTRQANQVIDRCAARGTITISGSLLMLAVTAGALLVVAWSAVMGTGISRPPDWLKLVILRVDGWWSSMPGISLDSCLRGVGKLLRVSLRFFGGDKRNPLENLADP